MTSRSSWFALWTFLLPFTLMNVAGWANPRRDRYSTKSEWVCRVLTFLCALVLTALTVGWLALTGLLLLPAARPEWGLGAAVVATVILGVCSTFVSTCYERHQPPWWAHEGEGQKILSPQNLSSPRFFDSATAHRRAWRAHFAVAVAGWAAIGFTYARDERGLALDLERGIACTTVIGLLLVALLGMASFKAGTSADTWRWSAPALAAGTAFFLTGGVPAAALIARNGGLEGFRGTYAFLFLDVYGLSLAAGLGVAVVVTGTVFLRKSPAEREDREPPKPAKEKLLFSSKARRAAKKAQALRHIDLAATALVGTFLIGGIGVFVGRVSRLPTELRWDAAPGRQFVWLALSALGVVVGFLVRDLWRNSRSLDRRRKIGQIWDVLTFWPRTVHPFAVRPYAERAVPELQEYLSRHSFAPARGRWTVTAHSQGSILVYAALIGTPRSEWGTTPLDLLTFGSPLATLYARAFPRYFTVESFGDLRGMLETQWQAHEGSWRNVFRATDAVGREVFTMHFSERDKNLDFTLGDPNQEAPTPRDCSPDAEHDLPLDGKVWGHSGYRRARRFKMLVHRSRYGHVGCDARS